MSTAATSNDLPKITVLYDNRCDDPALQEGFGFSCLVEWGNRKILFDTGGKGEAFFSNIQKRNIALNEITHVFFSHNHWDHTADIDLVLAKVKDNTPIYLPSPFSAQLEKKIPGHVEVKKVADFEQIDEEVYSLVLKGGYLCTSIYEQAIILKTSKGLIVITGCAHPGIIRIVHEAQARLGPVHLVLGGFHLHHSWKSTSAKVVRQMQDLKVEKVAPCHCAGDTAIGQFKKAYQENFIQTGTGTVIKI